MDKAEQNSHTHSGLPRTDPMEAPDQAKTPHQVEQNGHTHSGSPRKDQMDQAEQNSHTPLRTDPMQAPDQDEQKGDHMHSGPPNTSGVKLASTKTCSTQENALSPKVTRSSVKKRGRKRPLKVIQLPPSPKKDKASKRARDKRTIDPNRCAMCQGVYKEEDAAKWAGCDYCERWFHTHCVKVSLKKNGSVPSDIELGGLMTSI